MNSELGLTSQAKLDKFNKLLRTRNTLMPHQVAISVGISKVTAMHILFHLVYNGVAEIYLLVYHINHDQPIEKRPIDDGLPSLPFECIDCEQIINNPDDLLYDLTFDIITKTQIEISSHQYA